MSNRDHWSAIVLLVAVGGIAAVAPARVAAQTTTAPPPPPPGLERIVAGGTNEILIVVDPVWEAREARSRELRDKGRALYAAGRLPEAAKRFEEALSLSDVTAGLFPELADIYLRTGRTKDALDLYGFQVNRWKSKDTKTLLTYALLLTQARRAREAVPAYHAALAGMPRHEFLAVPLDLRFDAVPSVLPARHLEAAIETALGMLDYHAGYFEKSLPHLRRAAALYPRFATAHYYLGAALRRSPDRADQENADRALRKAMESGSPQVRSAAEKLRAGR